jgi:hypothetical protein
LPSSPACPLPSIRKKCHPGSCLVGAGASGIWIKLSRAHAIRAPALRDLMRLDDQERIDAIDAVMPNERSSVLQLNEGETPVVRPKRLCLSMCPIEHVRILIKAMK